VIRKEGSTNIYLQGMGTDCFPTTYS